MARLYANENFPLPAVEALRELGHDVVTTAEAGKAGQAVPDVEVLGFATAEGRVLITLNRKHFIRLHAVAADHSGIVVCTFDADFRAQAERIDSALRKLPITRGRLVRVNRPAVTSAPRGCR